MLVDSGATAEIPNDTKAINLLKAMQVLMSTVLFILPATLFCRFMRDERSAFLQLNRTPHLYFALTAMATILFALPAVSGLEALNAQMHVPAGLASIEQWMRGKEDEAQKITLLFFEDKSMGGLIINLLVMAFVAGLSEEIFFRGLLQQMFIKNKMNAHVAIIITAILFSAFHLQFFGFIPRMFLGIILGYLYYITQNLWTSIIAHFCNNAFAVIAMHFYNDDISMAQETQQQNTLGLAFIALSMTMVIFQLILLNKFVKRNNLQI
jgi:membrane protease YdiL (CAAX protease family)